MIIPLTEGKTLGSMSNRIHGDKVNGRPDAPLPINNGVNNKTITKRDLEHAITRLNPPTGTHGGNMKKAIVKGMEINDEYDDGEIVTVKFEYLVSEGAEYETVEISMDKSDAEKFKLGSEINLLS